MKKKGTWIATKLRMAQASKNHSNENVISRLRHDQVDTLFSVPP